MERAFCASKESRFENSRIVTHAGYNIIRMCKYIFQLPILTVRQQWDYEAQYNLHNDTFVTYP